LKGLLFDWGCNVHTTRTSIHGIGWVISSLLRLSILRFRRHSKLYSLLRSRLSGCHATLLLKEPARRIGRGWGMIKCDEMWRDWPPIFPFTFCLPIPPSVHPCHAGLLWVTVVHSERPTHANSTKMGQKKNHKTMKKGKQSKAKLTLAQKQQKWNLQTVAQPSDWQIAHDQQGKQEKIFRQFTVSLNQIWQPLSWGRFLAIHLDKYNNLEHVVWKKTSPHRSASYIIWLFYCTRIANSLFIFTDQCNSWKIHGWQILLPY